MSQTDIYEAIGEELNKLEAIEVLVNNAGTIYHIPEYFLNIPSDFNRNYFNLNMLSSTKLMEMILPKMVERRSGVIINVTSQMADFPTPIYSMYAASKFFLFVSFHKNINKIMNFYLNDFKAKYSPLIYRNRFLLNTNRKEF